MTIRLPAIAAVRDFTFPILPPTVSRRTVPFAARRSARGGKTLNLQAAAADKLDLACLPGPVVPLVC